MRAVLFFITLTLLLLPKLSAKASIMPEEDKCLPDDSIPLFSKMLQELVISSSRWCQESDVIPAKVTLLGFEQTNRYNPQTAADMLGLSGEVFIQKSQYGGGSPVIRGFATNRLLYSVDGVRMNTAIFRSGNIQNVISLDPFAIGSTEVLFGPGAVCYGSDAIGGVMLFNTLSTQYSNGEKPLLMASATLRSASVSWEKTAHAHFGVSWKRWALLSSFSYSSFGDLRQGMHGPEKYVMPYLVVPGYDETGVFDQVIENSDKRLQSPSAYSQYNVMQKLRYSPVPEVNLEYAFHLSRTSEYARYDRHQRMRNGKPRYAEWNYGPQKWMMNHLRFEHLHPNAIYDSLRVNLAMQRFEESRISRNLGESLRETQTEEVYAWSANLDVFKNLRPNLVLLYGTEFVKNDVASYGVGTDIVSSETLQITSRYPMADWYSLGVYSQIEWSMHRTLNMEAGLRYNHYYAKSDFSQVGYNVPFALQYASDAGNVSGNVGVNWRPSQHCLFRINYARGFRAPNVDDMGKLFDSVDGYVSVPNPDLKLEYADNIELGMVFCIGTFAKVGLTAFYTHLSNAIVRRNYVFNNSPTMEYQGEECVVQALQNAAEANVWGVQGSIDSRFARWFYAEANISWQRGFEELDNGDISPSRHVVPLFGRAAIGFKRKALCVEAYSAFQAECSAADMPEEEKGKTEIYALDSDGKPYSPAWITLNMRASYDFKFGLSVNATLENITDRRYRPYSSGISAPGINLSVGLTYVL